MADETSQVEYKAGLTAKKDLFPRPLTRQVKQARYRVVSPHSANLIIEALLISLRFISLINSRVVGFAKKIVKVSFVYVEIAR